MNRKQRRATSKSDMSKALRQQGLDATRQAVKLYSVSFAYVLYNKQGFDKERTLEALKQSEYVFDSISKNYVSFVDMQRCLEEELGITFVD